MRCSNFSTLRCNARVLLAGCLTFLALDLRLAAADSSRRPARRDDDAWERFKHELAPRAEHAIVTANTNILDGGGVVPPVFEASFNHAGFSVRGLGASRALRKGDIIVDAPSQWVLRADHPDVLGLFGPKGVPRQGDEVFAIACFLASELRLSIILRNQEDETKHVTTPDGHLRRMSAPKAFSPSSWTPYIRKLPSLSELQQFHPLYARQSLLDVFSALPAAARVSKHQQRLADNWALWRTVQPRLRSLRGGSPEVVARRAAAAQVTEEDITWASSIVITRGFTSLNGRPELVPLVDEINMDLPARRNVRWFQRFDGSFRAFVTDNVPEGSELFFDYIDGEHNASNTDLVSSYGFSLAGYPKKPEQLAEDRCHDVAQRAAGEAKAAGVAGPSALCGKGVAAGASVREVEPQLPIFCLLWRLAVEQCPGIASTQAAAAATHAQDVRTAHELTTTTTRSPSNLRRTTTLPPVSTTIAATTTTTTTTTTMPTSTTTSSTTSTTTTTPSPPSTSTTSTAATPPPPTTTTTTTTEVAATTPVMTTTTTTPPTQPPITTTLGTTTAAISTGDELAALNNEVAGDMASASPTTAPKHHTHEQRQKQNEQEEQEQVAPPPGAQGGKATDAQPMPVVQPVPSSMESATKASVNLNKAQEDLLSAIAR